MKIYITNKRAFVLYVIYFGCYVIVWPGDKKESHPKPHRIKVTALDLSAIFLRTFKLGYEQKFKNNNGGLEAELGYTHYSREDKTNVRGYYIGLQGHYHLSSNDDGNRGIVKIMPFYQKIYLNHYLKYNASTPGFNTFYYDYRKTKYTKERYGIYIMICWQRDLFKHFFLELNCGIGLMHFATMIPDGQVTQKFYRNGLFNHKNYYSPTIMQNLKLGFAF